jgi:hypothetical protein
MDHVVVEVDVAAYCQRQSTQCDGATVIEEPSGRCQRMPFGVGSHTLEDAIAPCTCQRMFGSRN